MAFLPPLGSAWSDSATRVESRIMGQSLSMLAEITMR
jgi:hypothetical protein